MKLEYVHNLRGLAILLIILAHAITTLPSSEEVVILRFLILNSSVIFVVIAGFLFAAIAERFTYKDYLVNKVKNVIFPYLFLSLPAALIYIFGYKTTHLWMDMEYFDQLPFILKYGYLLITGAHLGPLWFIPMICLFYLFFPVFIFIKNTNINYLIFILLVSLTLGFYLGRPLYDDDVFQSFFYFLPAYIWGICIYRYPYIFRFFKTHSIFYLVLSVIFWLIHCYFNGYNKSQDLIFKLLFSTILFSIFIRYFDKKIPILNIFAELSFFLYFIHGYFAGALRMLLKNQQLDIDNYNYIIIIASFSVILATSLISFYILRCFFGRYKRQFLGINY